MLVLRERMVCVGLAPRDVKPPKGRLVAEQDSSTSRLTATGMIIAQRKVLRPAEPGICTLDIGGLEESGVLLREPLTALSGYLFRHTAGWLHYIITPKKGKNKKKGS